MAGEFDLIVRGGTIVDGSGGVPFRGDVAIRGGVIVAVGAVDGSARREIDADGLIVTPGFVDIHTHYDGQAIWSDRMTPSSDHGVTTVVVGNCGVGFAPCRPGDRDALVDVMEGVEDIPEIVMAKGLSWEWESFPDYLDALDARPRDIDVAAYMPHSPLRVFVMGQRGIDREPATEADLARMRDLTREAVEAGALGFATSRVIVHRTSHGEFIPSYDVGDRELIAIGQGLKDAGRGVYQLVTNSFATSMEEEFKLLEELAETSGRPITYTFAQPQAQPDEWRGELPRLTAANRRPGVTIKGQIFPRPIGMLCGLTTSINPFSLCPSYQPLKELPLAERLAALRDPALREALIHEGPGATPSALYTMARNFQFCFPLGEPPNYEPAPETSVAAIAARTGRTPEEVAYDLLLEKDGRALLLLTLGNYADGNLDFIEQVLAHPDVVPGLGDGGAHYGMICDASYTTYALTHWTRDRSHGRFALPGMIKRLARDTAQLVGLDDRGLIAPGYKADINVIDYDRLTLHLPEVVHDLPGGGQRFHQHADGYVATIVAGEVIIENGEPTDARPGRLVRGTQAPAGVA